MHEEPRRITFQPVNTAILVVLILCFGYYIFIEDAAETGKLGALQRGAQNTVSYVTSPISDLFSEQEPTPTSNTPITTQYKPSPRIETQQQTTPPPTTVTTPPTPQKPTYDASKATAILDQATLAHAMYEKCSQRLIEYNSKVHLVRDQGTLYQWDGNVNNCLEEYLSRSQTLAELIRQDGRNVNQQVLSYIRDVTMQGSQHLRLLSARYAELSASRHQYIHQTYQTNTLIDLGMLIGESAGAISAGDAPSAINSLSDLYGWWYYNGGVIDTGWNQ